ncbi:MAG: efflux RND transporter permease subunit [Armatimonadota bacterium]|nr:efflux RND transporter permease subunit [Armatimonadota bacterium]
MNLSRFAINKPVTTAMTFMAIAFLGIIAFGRLPIDLLPDISFPTLNISTEYSGAGPQEVEREVTIPIENAMSTVPGVTEIFSTSQEGRSSVSLRFPWGADLDAAANDVRPALDRVRGRLPDAADTPRVFKFDPNLLPVVLLGIEARGDLSMLRDIAEDQLKPRLEQVEGVANVDIRGAREREIRVELDRARLEALGVSDRDVSQALRAESTVDPGGDVRVGSQRRVVRVIGRFASIDEIAQTVVATRQGIPIRVADVGRVVDTLADATSITRLNGRPSIVIAVSKRSGTNTVAVASRVFAVVDELNEQFPRARMTVISDGSKFIRRSIANVQTAAMLGSVLTMGVLLFFLRNVSSTLIISTAIPLSVLATILLMFWGGLTLNLITFGGLALAIGMLVDNAIVVLENIFRHREEGQPPRLAAEEATGEVGTALAASTLTTIVVFLPMFFTTGIASVMFRPLAYVVTVALLGSMLVALTLIPSLASRALVMGHGKGAAGRIAVALERGFVAVEDGFRRVLTAVMRRPALIVLPAIGVMLLAWSAIPLIGQETFPQTDEREFFVIMQMPRGTALEVTDRTARRVEQILAEETPGVERVATFVGGGFGPGGSHVTSFRVSLAPDAPRTSEVINELRRRIRVTGATFIYRPLSSLFLFRTPDPISIDLRGFDLETGNALARRLRGVLESVPGVTDLQVSREESAEEFSLRVDPIKAAAFGTNAAQVAASVSAYVGGTTATTFRSGGDDINVVVRLREADRATPDRLADLPISTSRGVVPLRQVAEITGTPGPLQIQRRNRERIITLTGNITGRDIGATIRDVRQALLAQRLPQGFSIAFGGEFEDQRESFAQLTTGFLMSLVLVYMVMASQFERLLEPLLIMAAVPFALVGVIAALVFTGTTLNVQSGLGAIVLVGVAVNNAIVMITYALQLQDQGVPLREALARAGQRRLRPILMTSLTTIFGLLPLAIGIGEGSELQSPLARAIVGGLITSTVSSLLLIPALYMILDSALRWVRNRREAPLRLPEAEGVAEAADGK